MVHAHFDWMHQIFHIFYINIDDKSGWPSSWGSFNFCVLHFYSFVHICPMNQKKQLSHFILQQNRYHWVRWDFCNLIFIYKNFSDWNIRRKQTLDLLWKLLLPVVNCDDYWIFINHVDSIIFFYRKWCYFNLLWEFLIVLDVFKH